MEPWAFANGFLVQSVPGVVLGGLVFRLDLVRALPADPTAGRTPLRLKRLGLFATLSIPPANRLPPSPRRRFVEPSRRRAAC